MATEDGVEAGGVRGVARVRSPPAGRRRPIPRSARARGRHRPAPTRSPAASRAAPTSSRSSARSWARSSTRAPAARSRASGSGGSSRATSTRCTKGGRSRHQALEHRVPSPPSGRGARRRGPPRSRRRTPPSASRRSATGSRGIGAPAHRPRGRGCSGPDRVEDREEVAREAGGVRIGDGHGHEHRSELAVGQPRLDRRGLAVPGWRSDDREPRSADPSCDRGGRTGARGAGRSSSRGGTGRPGC